MGGENPFLHELLAGKSQTIPDMKIDVLLSQVCEYKYAVMQIKLPQAWQT
jgi:hypothetical protein